MKKTLLFMAMLCGISAVPANAQEDPDSKYIRNFHTPHTKIIIDWNEATITSDVGGWSFDKSLSDLIKQ